MGYLFQQGGSTTRCRWKKRRISLSRHTKLSEGERKAKTKDACNVGMDGT